MLEHTLGRVFLATLIGAAGLLFFLRMAGRYPSRRWAFTLPGWAFLFVCGTLLPKALGPHAGGAEIYAAMLVFLAVVVAVPAAFGAGALIDGQRPKAARPAVSSAVSATMGIPVGSSMVSRAAISMQVHRGSQSENVIQQEREMTPDQENRASSGQALASMQAEPDSLAGQPFDEGTAYGLIAQEVESSRVDKGLWLMAFDQSNGNETDQKLIYIRARIQAMRARHEDVARQRLADQERDRLREGAARRELESKIVTFRRGTSLTKENLVTLVGAAVLDRSIISVRNQRGDQLLHVAAASNFHGLATKLVELGADKSSPNGSGRKPYELCSDNELKNFLAP